MNRSLKPSQAGFSDGKKSCQVDGQDYQGKALKFDFPDAFRGDESTKGGSHALLAFF